MDAGPFERHIREAIELNRRRTPLYAEASAGVSLRISRPLIRRERLLLPVARWFDRRALPYQHAGVPVMDDLFVSMAAVPELRPHQPANPPELAPPSASSLIRAIRGAYAAGSFPAAAAEADLLLEHLAVDPGYWCMLRHILESARRLCLCAGPHRRAARQAGLPSPEWLHRLLLRLHVGAIRGAMRLDARALPLQRQGIPILCRDLPPIPPLP